MQRTKAFAACGQPQSAVDKDVNINWSSTTNLFYNNSLNFVYQTTPYQF